MGGGRRGRKLTGSNTVQTHSRLPSCLLQDTYTQFEFETNRPQFLPIADLMLKDDGNTEYWGCVLMALWPWVALLLLLEPITSLTPRLVLLSFSSQARCWCCSVQDGMQNHRFLQIMQRNPCTPPRLKVWPIPHRYVHVHFPPPFAKACTMLPYFRSA